MTCARTNSGVRRFGKALLTLAGGLLLGAFAAAGEPQDSPAAALEHARAALARNPGAPEDAWRFARACFDAGEAATNKTARAQVAEQGIDACRQALAITNSAPLRYYLALNLGELAQTRGLSALKLVNQMEQELLQAVELDPRFDYAGPERSLGLLYRDAPSFASVGSRTKARIHLLRAIELAPDYPENRLELVEAYLKWNDRTAARHEFEDFEKSLPKARAELKGDRWEKEWRDWEAHVQKLRKRLQDQSKLETPRH